MKVVRIDLDAHLPDYGILCQKLLFSDDSRPPFGSTHCVIEPDGETTRHHHFEREVFLVLRGSGTIEVDGESQEVTAGDAILLPPSRPHTLKNLSSKDALHFLSLYWDPELSLAPAPEAALVTSAPPTPNGPLHLGHVSGPYVAADVFHRALKMRGTQSRYLSGSDAFQSYVATKAQAEGVEPEVITRRFGAKNHATLKALGCDLSLFLRPVEDPEYRAFVQAFFQSLVDQGALRLESREHLFCDTCERYLHEARVQGRCPRCGEGASGNGCETCAFVNDCVDLIEPRCAICQGSPRLDRAQRFVFPLPEHSEWLRSWFFGLEVSPRLKHLVEAQIEAGLPEVSASHFDSWGIPVPGHPGQVIYEWLEMAAGYRYASQELFGEALRPYRDQGAEVHQFFGFDNAFFYTLFLPAVIRAEDPEAVLPQGLFSNEFYLYRGSKFSTSRNHAVWADESLESLPSDLLRFHLAWDRPEFESTDFSEEGLLESAEFLAAKLEAWTRDWNQLRKDPSHTKLPVSDPPPAFERRLHERLRGLARSFAQSLSKEEFSLRRAARSLIEFLTEVHDFRRASQRAPGSEVALRRALELRLLGWFAKLSAPLLPKTSARLLEGLGQGPQAPRTTEDSPFGFPLELPPLPAPEGLRTFPDLEFERSRGVLLQSLNS